MPPIDLLEMDEETEAAVHARLRFHTRYAEQLLEARDDERPSGDAADGRRLVATTDERTFRAIVATSFLRAAELALLLGDPAVDLLRRAALQYVLAGLPFGALLGATAGTQRPLDDPTLVDALTRPRWADRAAETAGEPPGEPALTVGGASAAQEGTFAFDALVDPVQQTYLVFTFLTDVESSSVMRPVLDATLDHLERHGSIPVGAQSAPLGTYVSLARHLLDVATGPTDAAFAAADTLGALGVMHAANLALAQQDRYHWRRALSPTVLVDIDQVLFLRILLDLPPGADAVGGLADRGVAALGLRAAMELGPPGEYQRF